MLRIENGLPPSPMHALLYLAAKNYKSGFLCSALGRAGWKGSKDSNLEGGKLSTLLQNQNSGWGPTKTQCSSHRLWAVKSERNYPSHDEVRTGCGSGAWWWLAMESTTRASTEGVGSCKSACSTHWETALEAARSRLGSCASRQPTLWATAGC